MVGVVVIFGAFDRVSRGLRAQPQVEWLGHWLGSDGKLMK